MKISDMGVPEEVDPHTPEGKGEMTAKMQNLSAVFDALGLCKFLLAGGIGPVQLAQFVEMVTGVTYTVPELLQVGERIYTFKRLYNQALGLDVRQDTLTRRILNDKRKDGFSGDVLPDLEKMRAELYAVRGWDSQGRVSPEKVDELGLAEYERRMAKVEEKE